MPIDYKKYPSNWKTEIRPAILKRANSAREIVDHWKNCCDVYGYIVIVLTIAHINDPNPMNCSPSNLAALCQRCHNRHDAKMRAKNRKKKIFKDQLTLF